MATIAPEILEEPTEVWKPIPATPGYEASNQGRIRSYWFGRRVRMDKPPRIKKPQRTTSGTHTVGIRSPQGYFNESVAGLILLTFKGVYFASGARIAYLDGDKSNNRPENLCYESQTVKQLRIEWNLQNTAKLEARELRKKDPAKRREWELAVCEAYESGERIVDLTQRLDCNNLYRLLHRYNIPLRRASDRANL